MNEKLKAALLVLATQVGCSVVQQKPFTCPQKGGAAWTEVTSAHFVLRTDLDRDVADRTSAELEATLAALASLGFGTDSLPSTKLEVVYFRREQEARTLLPKQAAGGFYWSGRHDLERTPMACVYGDFVNATRRTFQHELTHFLTHTYCGNVPIWLDEGLAEYLETLDREDGTAVVGRAPPQYRFWLGEWRYESADPVTWFAHIPAGDAVPVAQLATMSTETFYDKGDLDPASSAGQNAARIRTTHYASAWSLVHLLISNETYQAAFEAYLKKLQEGQKSNDAWDASIGLLSADKLESDYRDALLPRETKTLVFKYEAPRSVPERVRALTDPEVHLLWARIRRWDNDADRAAAQADIDEAAAVAPDLPEVALVRAAMAVGAKDFEGAEHALNRFADSQDPRVLNALGWTKLEVLSGRLKVAPAEVERELGPIAKRLGPVASKAAHFDLLARYSEAAGDLEAGLAHEKRAMSAEPQCSLCLAFAAHLLDKKGNVREALELATIAGNLLPEGTHSATLDSDIAKYRQHLTEGRTAPKVDKSVSKPETKPAPKTDRRPNKPR